VSVTVPPRDTDNEHGHDLAERVAELEALIEEARRRARRRRRLYGVVVFAAIAAGAAALFDGGSSGVSVGRSVAEGSPGSSATQSDHGRWGPPHGPDGGNVFALAIDPANSKIVYAGGWGNVFKSTNAGGSWTNVTTQPWARVTALAIDPSRPETVYAGTDGTDRGIAKTVDGGRHWQMVNGGLFDRTNTFPWRGEGIVSSLVVDAGDPSIVYAITGIGLFRTTNGGARWNIIGPRQFRKRTCDTCNGRSYGYWLAAAIDPDRGTIYAGWTGGGTATKLYQSSDRGDSWKRIAARGPVDSFEWLALAGDSPGTLFAAGDWLHRGVVKSTDGGATWIPAGLASHHIGAFNVDPGSRALYVSTEREAFKTSDGGATWQTVGNRADVAYGSVATDPHAPDTVYGAGGNGVVKSIDGGRTWAASNSGLVSSLVESLVLAPRTSKTLYAGTLGQGVFKSTDGGQAWLAARSGLGQKSVTALAATGRSIYAGTREFGVFTSTDGAASWSPVNTGLSAKYVSAFATDPRDRSTVYVVSGARNSIESYGGGGEIFKTVNGGRTWRAIAVPAKVQSLAIDSQTAATMFAGTNRGIYRSRDGGGSWHLVSVRGGPPPGRWGVYARDRIQVIVVDPLDPANVYAGLGRGGVLKSSDGGDTWVVSNAGLTDKRVRALAIDPRDSRNVYVSTDGGVFRTTNGAHSWHSFNRGLAGTSVATFAIDQGGRTVYAGTAGYGVVASATSG
jgi:photosystem II stability/assembly factor-like uncharacterized protein